MTLQDRFWNSPLIFATSLSSVAHTGVKSLGCEKSMAQPSPIHSWKLTVPSLVSAVKSGASSLIRSDIFCSSFAQSVLERYPLAAGSREAGYEDSYARPTSL